MVVSAQKPRQTNSSDNFIFFLSEIIILENRD